MHSATGGRLEHG